MSLSNDDLRIVAEIFRRIIRELYSPGFARALLYHIKAKGGEEFQGLEDLIKVGLNSPRRVYDAFADVLGGTLAAELFLSTTFREVFRRLDIEFSVEQVVTVFRENDAEGLRLIINLILTASRSLRYG